MINYLKNRLNKQLNLSPDGVRYISMGSGEPTCSPFYFRWLLPFFCKNSNFRWNLVSEVSTFLLIPLTFILLKLLNCSDISSLCGALSVFGLSGVFWLNRALPVLVDSTAMVFCLLSLITFYYDESLLALSIVFSVLAGSVRESSPLFLFFATFNPYFLLGLTSPILIKLLRKEGKDQCSGLPMQAASKPFETCIPLRHNSWNNFKLMVLPWGGLLAALFFPSLELLITLSFSYGVLWMVTDTVRIYQWAWMIMVITCFTNIPEYLCIPVCALTIFNPYKTNGG